MRRGGGHCAITSGMYPDRVRTRTATKPSRPLRKSTGRAATTNFNPDPATIIEALAAQMRFQDVLWHFRGGR